MKIELNLLDNGLDFIMEGIKPTHKIWKEDGESGLKYSVLNVFSGIQLILKERLRKEHWSLIFEDVSNANEQRLIQGDFVSVNYNGLIKRLQGISNINIKDAPINDLRKLRNKFEHFEAKIEVKECKHLLAQAIRELIIFWNENIADYANAEQKKKFDIIMNITNEFDSYVTNMLENNKNKINNIVNNKQGILVHCDKCSNHSFMIYKDKERSFECFVCESKISREEYLTKKRNKEIEREVDLSFIKSVDYEKNCSKCNNQTRVLIQPGYIAEKGEYQCDYFFCVNCLDYETQGDINSRELEKELLELEKNHSGEELIEILKGRIKAIDKVEQ